MYFNSNKNDTNIDKDFNNNGNFFYNLIDFFNRYKVFVVGGIVALIILIIVFVSFSNNSTKTYLVLSGEESITLYQGNDFIDPGYEAYDKKDNDLTSDVKINSNLDINKPGEYEITYELNGIIKTRKVNIVSKSNNSNTFIYLNSINNDVNVYLMVGDKYVEPGYNVFSSNGTNLNNRVKVTGTVDTSKKGSYKLIYSVIDDNNVTISSSRNVVVMDIDINLSSKYNDGKTYINVKISDDYFSYLLLPDGSKITNKTYTYQVNKVGKYTFTVYNKMGISKSASINIDTLDKTPPKINSCKVVVTDNSTKFTISSNDSDIAKYLVNNNSALTYTSSSFTVNKVIENAKIYLYDKSNNYSSSSCTYTYQQTTTPSNPTTPTTPTTPSNPATPSNPTIQIYEPIKPTGKENIKYNESTDTLKVWIEKVDRKNRIDFYVTHIWVKDPHKQFKSQVPDKYGKELLTAGTLFKNAVKKQNLTNKLAVAVNASGFILKGYYGNSVYNVNPNFNKSAAQPMVISNGKIIRDLTDQKLPNSLYAVYGINSEGLLTHHSFKNAKTNAERKKVYENVIADGIENTFAFSPRLVENGKVISTKTDKNTRQAICQINKNNFVFITDVYGSDRYTGFSFKELGEYMVKLGCQTGFNLDGGGSANLYIKRKNKTTVTAVSSTVREIADIIYFHE